MPYPYDKKCLYQIDELLEQQRRYDRACRNAVIAAAIITTVLIVIVCLVS